MNSTDIELSYTIDNMISEGKNTEFTLSTTSILSGNNSFGIVFPYKNILVKHIGLIKSKCVDITLSDSELMTYQYQPHLLSYTLYKTTDLWFMLLMINDMIDVTQFNVKKIKLLRKEDLKLLNNIFMAEEKNTKDVKYVDED